MSTIRDDVLNASFSSAYSLMGLQLFSRSFTFLLNQALLRMSSPKAFGTAAIQFELVLSTILFLSREGVRNSLLRANKPRPDESATSQSKDAASSPSADTSGVALLPVLLGFPLAIATTQLYRHFASADTRSQPNFDRAVSIYALSAMLELLSEPMHNRAMSELRTSVRVRAEGLAILSKTVATFVLLLNDSRSERFRGDITLLAFAIGQLAYGTTLLVVYVISYRGDIGSLRRARDLRFPVQFHPKFLRLSITMTTQSILKLILTEGDKLILSRFSPLEDQGGYAIAINYGSLVARIIFQPIEESIRLFFSKLLSNAEATSRGQTDRRALSRAADSLVRLLSIQLSFCFIFLVFGPDYVPIILRVVLPFQYLSTSAPVILAAWVWYIPILAINGGLEAFLSSVATTRELNAQSRWMAGFSVVFISAALAFYRLGLGDVSLVYANIINLSTRIAYCLWFVASYFHRHHTVLPWRKVLPRWEVLALSSVSKLVIFLSGRMLNIPKVMKGAHGLAVVLDTHVIIHTLMGGVLALSCIGSWWMFSGRFMTSLHKKTN